MGGLAGACTSISSPATISTADCFTVAADLAASGSAITVNVSDIRIDLNGHTITGAIDGPGASGVVVTGPGLVTGSGGHGIGLGPDAVIVGVTAHANSGAGISVGNNSVVTESIVESNGGDGIDCGTGCSLTGNIADSNTGSGISLGDQGGVLNNAMQGNTQYGLYNSGDNKGGFGENVMYNNGSGSYVTKTGSMLNNVCAGSGGC